MGVLLVEVEQAKAIEPAIVAGIAKSVGVSEDAVEVTSKTFSSSSVFRPFGRIALGSINADLCK